MRKTRRSGLTASEAQPLQLHIAGPQKGVGSLSVGRPLAARAGCGHRRPFQAIRSAVLSLVSRRGVECARSRADNKTPKGTSCPSTGVPAIAIARNRRPAAGPVADDLAVLGPVSRDRPGDCSPVRFDSECRPLQARFRMNVRSDSHKCLVHQAAGPPQYLSTKRAAERVACGQA
jgi:hypothetical protein